MTAPTECEVALLRLRASTYCTKCDDCERVAARLRATADEDATRCRVQLTPLVQRELSILCTDAYRAAELLRDELHCCHPDAEGYDGKRAIVAGEQAEDALASIYQRLRVLLGRAITPSEKAQEWVKLHTEADGVPPPLSRAITASDCTLGRLQP